MFQCRLIKVIFKANSLELSVMSKKQIHFNAFEMNTINHMAHGLWAHPEDQRVNYKTAEYWINLAKLLEKGLFDAIFLADIGGVYEPYEGGV